MPLVACPVPVVGRPGRRPRGACTSGSSERCTSSAWRPPSTARLWSPEAPYDVVNLTSLPASVSWKSAITGSLAVFSTEKPTTLSCVVVGGAIRWRQRSRTGRPARRWPRRPAREPDPLGHGRVSFSLSGDSNVSQRCLLEIIRNGSIEVVRVVIGDRATRVAGRRGRTHCPDRRVRVGSQRRAGLSWGSCAEHRTSWQTSAKRPATKEVPSVVQAGQAARPRDHPVRRRLRRRHAAHRATASPRSRRPSATTSRRCPTSRPRSARPRARCRASRRSRSTSPTTTSSPPATPPTCWSR